MSAWGRVRDRGRNGGREREGGGNYVTNIEIESVTLTSLFVIPFGLALPCKAFWTSTTEPRVAALICEVVK